VITLTTDFGDGCYVAQLKGAIFSINPQVKVVDLTHQISPQNVREAALFLAWTVFYFPPGTVHLAVVDPGVGTDRALVLVQAQGHFFLGPDNGLFSWVLGAAARVWRLDQPVFWREAVSDTFHGRDILAPVAAHLSLGVRPAQVGTTSRCAVVFPWPEPTSGRGEVLAVDRFGNLITNLGRDQVPEGCQVQVGTHPPAPIVRTYADGPIGAVLGLWGSGGLLEIAVREGHAAQLLGVGVGEPVWIGPG